MSRGAKYQWKTIIVGYQNQDIELRKQMKESHQLKPILSDYIAVSVFFLD